ncbi:MAG: tyrosine-type recombinase/integrase [Acidimicrobiales bacterium]
MSPATSRARAPQPKKDGRGKWRFVFDSQHPNADGSRRQIRRGGFATERAARAALKAELERDAALLVRDDRLTVASVLDQFILSKRVAGKAPATIAQYEWAATHATKRLGSLSADELTHIHLDKLYAELLKPRSARSVAIVAKTVKAAYALAVDRGQVMRNPARLATPIAAAANVRPYWSPQQVGQFLTYVERRAASGRNQYRLPLGLVELMADTGARRGELLGLRWESVKLDASTISITQQLVGDTHSQALSLRPTKRPRSKSTIGLHPATVDALRARRRQQNQDRLLMGSDWPQDDVARDLVFTWANGQPIHPKVLTRTIARLSVDAGLPRLTAHGLRHSFATAALSARVPVEVVAARLGNTTRVVQEVYQHVIPADDQHAAQTVGDLYRNAN